MKKEKNKEEKTYRSLAEIEKKFLPNCYRRMIGEKKHKKPGDFGCGLAINFLEDIRRQLIE